MLQCMRLLGVLLLLQLNLQLLLLQKSILLAKFLRQCINSMLLFL